MADIELVIKIPEEVVKNDDYVNYFGIVSKKLIETIKNGIPLPKGHGKLVDVDEVIKIANKTKDLHGAIWNAQTIIEADKEQEDGTNK